MPLIWMGADLPPMLKMAFWPAIHLIIVFQITCGAVSERFPPSCVSIKDYASQQTAASTVTVWTDTVCVMMVGRVLLVTLWCVSHQLADPMASVPPMAVSVMLVGEERTAAKSASLVSMVTAAIRPAPVLMAVPVIPSTDAAPALQVSMATTVSKCVLWVSTVCPALMSVNVRIGVHVTHKQEAATPHCQEAPTTPYTQLDTAWLERCLYLGGEKKTLTESGLILRSERG